MEAVQLARILPEGARRKGVARVGFCSCLDSKIFFEASFQLTFEVKKPQIAEGEGWLKVLQLFCTDPEIKSEICIYFRNLGIPISFLLKTLFY